MILEDLEKIYKEKIARRYQNIRPLVNYYIENDIGYIEVEYNVYTSKEHLGQHKYPIRHTKVYTTINGKSINKCNYGTYEKIHMLIEESYKYLNTRREYDLSEYASINIDKNNQLYILYNNNIVYLTNDEKKMIDYRIKDSSILNNRCFHKCNKIIKNKTIRCKSCMNILEGYIRIDSIKYIKNSINRIRKNMSIQDLEELYEYRLKNRFLKSDPKYKIYIENGIGYIEVNYKHIYHLY